MRKGTTPTQIFTLPDTVDLTAARNIFVTYSDMKKKKILQKTGDQVEIDPEHPNVVSVDLSQEETLKMPKHYQVQINWTFSNGKRGETNILHLKADETLEDEVLP